MVKIKDFNPKIKVSLLKNEVYSNTVKSIVLLMVCIAPETLFYQGLVVYVLLLSHHVQRAILLCNGHLHSR